MDSMKVSNLVSGFMILVGVASIIVGIVKVIAANKKQLGKGYKLKTICSSAFLAIFCFFAASLFGQVHSERGECARANHPYSIENITYGQAIDATCEDVQWSGANFDKSEGGTTYLQMDGTCRYGGKKREITIQFNYGTKDWSLIKESTPFEISFVGLDGAKEASDKEMKDIIYYMFEKYAQKHNISLEKSMKNGILYTKAWNEEREDAEDSGYIDVVRESCPRAYSGITYGDAFSNFFDEPEWNYISSEDGKDIVEFTGNCRYDEEEITVCVQFAVNDETFKCTHLDYDGKKQDKEELNSMLDAVFSTYVEDYGAGDEE